MSFNFDEKFQDFLDNIPENYIFKSKDVECPINPFSGNLRWHCSDGTITPNDLRKLADDIEEYNQKYEHYLEMLQDLEDENEKILDNFYKDLLKIFQLENHPKSQIFIDVCYNEVRFNFKTAFCTDYLRDIACKMLSLHQLV